MTNMMEAKVADLPEEDSGNGRRILWMMLASFGILMVAGAITGFLVEHQNRGDGSMSITAVLVLVAFVGMIGGLAYSIWRNAEKIKASGDPFTPRERLNNRMITGFGLLGGLMAIVLMIAGDVGNQNTDIFSSDPISPAVAVGLALMLGLLMPLMSWYWHARVIDELEADAYRSGAMLAMYAFWIVAPVWWLLWRGGMLPAPDGVALYLMTTFVALIIWFWKKYR
jgi:hypothetical protein